MSEVKFIPMEALIKDGNVPEGKVKVKCKFCNREFAVPSEEAAKMLMSGTYTCEECKSEFEKEQAAKSAAAMAAPSDAADTVAKALGN